MTKTQTLYGQLLLPWPLPSTTGLLLGKALVGRLPLPMTILLLGKEPLSILGLCLLSSAVPDFLCTSVCSSVLGLGVVSRVHRERKEDKCVP